MKTLRSAIELIALLGILSTVAILALYLDTSKTPDFAVYVAESGSSESRFSVGYQLLDSITRWLWAGSADRAVSTAAWIAYFIIILGSWLLSSKSAVATLLVASNSGIYAFIHIRATIAIGFMLLALWLAWFVKPNKNEVSNASWVIYVLGGFFHPILLAMAPVYGYLIKKGWRGYLLSRRWYVNAVRMRHSPRMGISIGTVIILAVCGWSAREAVLVSIPLVGAIVPFEPVRDAAINYSAYMGAVIDTNQTNAYVAVGLSRCIVLSAYCSVAREGNFHIAGTSIQLDQGAQQKHFLLCKVSWIPPVVAFLIACFAGQEGFTRLVSIFNPLIDIGIGLGIASAIGTKRHLPLFLVSIAVVMGYTSARIAMLANFLS
jgi:hypothetical protein